MAGLLIYCRAGFEGEAAAEIRTRAEAEGAPGFCRAKADSGLVVYEPSEPDQARRLLERIGWSELVFARQLLLTSGLLAGLSATDRASPLAAAVAGLTGRVAAAWVESADSEPGRRLSGLCRSLRRPFERALALAGLLGAPGAEARAHALLVGPTAGWPAISLLANSAPWPAGILRLKMPRGAVSRSTLKLDEALQVLLTPAQRQGWLREGMRAVDLGAAPGGWSWQLARRGLYVTAVDNARLDSRLLAGGMVEHLRADGFRYRPREPMDWMVCDMVEQPARIAELVGRWLAEGWCRRCIFNLKLPMKRRYQETVACRERIATALAGRGLRFELKIKQLYHDREEVTGFARRLEVDPP